MNFNGIFHTKLLLLFLLIAVSSTVNASEKDSSSSSPSSSPSLLDFNNPYRLSPDISGKRGIYWAPLGSLILPGLDQYLEQQYQYGATYSSIAVVGLFSSLLIQEKDDYFSKNPGDQPVDETERSERKQVKNFADYRSLGSHMYMFSGFLSAYHSFQTAVGSRASDFNFIKKRETPKEVLLSPFEFSYLGRPTTFIPLGLALALAGTSIKSRTHKDRYTSYRDGVFLTGGHSYMAGTAEEAAFRGWLMPMLHYKTGSPIWANIISSIGFGASHYSSENKFPWTQTLLGAYFGYLTQRNSYSIKESIFVHTWWDVIAIGTLLLAKKNGHDIEVYGDIVNFTF